MNNSPFHKIKSLIDKHDQREQEAIEQIAKIKKEPPGVYPKWGPYMAPAPVCWAGWEKERDKHRESARSLRRALRAFGEEY